MLLLSSLGRTQVLQPQPANSAELGTPPTDRPHILFALADDLGFGEVTFTGPAPEHLWPQGRRSLTPNLDQLAEQGTVLHRHYMFMICSPSRSAIQAGRNPIHVNVVNTPMEDYNPTTNVSGGVPCNMTGMGEVMTRGGYAAHMLGKWHAGSISSCQTPKGRGYSSYLGYLGIANDYWTFDEEGEGDVKDLWRSDEYNEVHIRPKPPSHPSQPPYRARKRMNQWTESRPNVERGSFLAVSTPVLQVNRCK